MIFAVPLIGPLIGFILMFFLAIPFYFLWNSMAPTYFYWLPEVYRFLPFWDCVWLFMLVAILKIILLPSFRSDVKVQK